ncbi:MAG: D-sedoheptulose 7-phosphate isomerase [Mucilaginibacter sp.]|uniref:D-sedoheptulose 7-phosphate isomerase n=1 Tax=Mucilaginibacter sp. TaxID=1882438 RepID=UPI003266DCAA
MNFKQAILNDLYEAQQVLADFIDVDENIELIAQAAALMSGAIKNGNKIISCGNGGSHCDAMHFAEELTGRYRNNREPLAAIAISDPSYLSCVGNDFGYEQVFSRFITGLGKPGDVLLAISTSGQSESIVNAIIAAKQKGVTTVILTGKDGGKLKGMGDIEICINHFGYADRIQEMHIKIIHIMIMLIEKQLGFDQLS